MSLDASAHWLVHVPESTDGYVHWLVLDDYFPSHSPSSARSTASIPSAHQARVNSFKRSAAESFIEDSLSADPRKRQHLQAPALSSTPTVLAQVHPAADVSVYEASTPADDILGEVDLAALDHQGKSVPARLDVGTPSLSSNAFNTSSLSVFSALQASGQRTKNHVCAPQIGAASVTKIPLGTRTLSTPAHGSTTNAPLQLSSEDISADVYGSRLASDFRSTPTVDMDDYTRAITSCAGLEQQIRALQDQLAAKTEECEQTRQKVPQLLADIVSTSWGSFPFPRCSKVMGCAVCVLCSCRAGDTPER